MDRRRRQRDHRVRDRAEDRDLLHELARARRAARRESRGVSARVAIDHPEDPVQHLSWSVRPFGAVAAVVERRLAVLLDAQPVVGELDLALRVRIFLADRVAQRVETHEERIAPGIVLLHGQLAEQRLELAQLAKPRLLRAG